MFVFSILTLSVLFTISDVYGQVATSPFPLSNVVVRLANGLNNREGRVEVYYNGQWGTICSDGWSITDAGVICRMVGFNGVARPVLGSKTNNTYGPGTGPIFLRGVQCDGNEQNIAQCPYQGWGDFTGTCVHNEDAGVVCLGEMVATSTTTPGLFTTRTTVPPKICNNPSPRVQLVDASNNVTQSAQGRVRYLYNGTWRGICNDRWGVNDAIVICRMLCYNPVNARAVIGSSTFGNSTEGFWLDSVVCNGSETDIANCSHSPWGNVSCDATEAAGVSCLSDIPSPAPLPSPIIQCPASEQIVAQFSRATDSRLLPAYLSVSGPSGQTVTNCNYTTAMDPNYVTISIPYVGCNTTRTMNDSCIMYTNYVRYSVPPPSDVISRTDTYYIQVSCLINRTTNDNNAFNPQAKTPPPQSGNGNYKVQIELFQDSQFNVVLTDNPLKVTIGDWLFVGVQLYSTDPSLKLVLDSCYVSPSQAADVSPMYYLISNKCALDSTVTLYPINDTLFAFRFQSFKFLSNNASSMYIHANVHVCSVTEKTGNCDRNCLNPQQSGSGGSKRRRRGISDVPMSITSSLSIVVVELPPAIFRPTSTAAILALDGTKLPVPTVSLLASTPSDVLSSSSSLGASCAISLLPLLGVHLFRRIHVAGT